VLVGLAKPVAVFVADTVIVGLIVCVATDVPGVDVLVDTLVAVACWGTVVNEEPGVRTASIHAGLVRMAGSTGSMKATGLFVRKSLLGSSLDSTFVSSSQCGVKRSAQPPADRIPHSPNRRMKAMTAQSRRSCSVVLMHASV
jgi:hypothetical protein